MRHIYVVYGHDGNCLYLTECTDTAEMATHEGYTHELIALYGEVASKHVKVFFDKDGQPVAALGAHPPANGDAMPLQIQIADKHRAIEADWLGVR